VSEQITNWLVNNKQSLREQFQTLTETKEKLLKDTDLIFRQLIHDDFYNAIRETILFQITKDLNITPEEAIIHIETLTNNDLNDFLQGEES
jgi:hypothetical protein